MITWAVVPVKPLRRGKSRLAAVLDEESRYALNHCLLENTLETLRGLTELECTLVISRDPQALALARAHGARTVMESGPLDLNSALSRAVAVLRQFSVSGMLIVPSDLPLVTSEEIQLVLDAGRQEPKKYEPKVVVVPDRRMDGTNAMLINPSGLFPFSFGPGSFQRHCTLAEEAGARLTVLHLPTVALDLDLPEDLQIVRDAEEVLRCRLTADLAGQQAQPDAPSSVLRKLFDDANQSSGASAPSGDATTQSNQRIIP